MTFIETKIVIVALLHANVLVIETNCCCWHRLLEMILSASCKTTYRFIYDKRNEKGDTNQKLLNVLNDTLIICNRAAVPLSSVENRSDEIQFLCMEFRKNARNDVNTSRYISRHLNGKNSASVIDAKGLQTQSSLRTSIFINGFSQSNVAFENSMFRTIEMWINLANFVLLFYRIV